MKNPIDQFLSDIPDTWQTIEGLPLNIGTGRSLTAHPDASSMLSKFFLETPSGLIYGRVYGGSATEGPPGHIHGGASAYILDESMGTTVWAYKLPAVAKQLRFDYLQVAPTQTELQIKAYLSRVEPERAEVTAELQALDGTPYVRGVGEFSIITRKRMEWLLKRVDAGKYPMDLDEYKWAPDPKNQGQD